MYDKIVSGYKIVYDNFMEYNIYYYLLKVL